MALPIAQPLLANQRPLPSPAEDFWGFYSPSSSSLTNFTNYATTSALWPGTQDFCFETWIYMPSGAWYNTPANLVSWGSGGNASGPAASNFALTVSPGFMGVGYGITVNILGQGAQIITSGSSANLTDQWGHLALSRIGSTVVVWWKGQMYARIEDFVGDITYANVGGDGWWFSGGPSGDRDETFGFGVTCIFRNMRWTVGDSVYPDSYNITPPSFYDNIAPITGTKFIWWPASNTFAGNWAGSYNGSWIPDYNPDSLTFTGTSGNSNYLTSDILAYVYPQNPLTNYYSGPIDSALQGTWTTGGTTPNQAVISNTGPASIIGSTYGDFTATGSNVNITSSNAAPFGGTGYDGMNIIPLTMYLWFYVPANITDECKNIISVEATNGFCLNIGRPGQGLDWVSIYTFDGVEQAYGKHVWARNAWNYLVISRPGNNGNAPSPSWPSPFYAWAGNNTQTYAQSVPLTDTGGSLMSFETYGTVSIGSRVGSSVSCQMYLGMIQTFCSYFNGSPAPIFTGSDTQVPIQTFTTRLPQSNMTFTFQGTPGDTNIQPGGF